MALLQNQLKSWAKSKGTASAADIHVYSAAIRAQMGAATAQNPFPRKPLY
jgi:hypothetical protein